MYTYHLWVEVRSGGYATVADVSLLVHVEPVRSFGQTGYHSGNRHGATAVSLDKSHVSAHLAGSLEDDYGFAFVLKREREKKMH